MRFHTSSAWLVALGLLGAISGCKDYSTQDTPREDPKTTRQPGSIDKPAPPPGTPGGPGTPPTEKDQRKAEADLKSAPNYKIDGSAKLEEVPGGVKISVKVEDGPPGKKGIHVHQRGDCSDIPGKSMGEHLAGAGHKHGLPGTPSRHLGDLGNIHIDETGDGKLEITVEGANLRRDDPASLTGHALVIHSGEDTGNDPGGVPIACAVIEAA